MSLLTDVGARVRATSGDLPVDLVRAAAERLRTATELLDRVRQASVDPIGVPQLGRAVEHAERAVHQLLATQDILAEYLAFVGLTGEPPTADGVEPRVPRPAPGAAAPPRRTTAGPLSSWWRTRVAELTGVPDGEPAPDPAADAAELLRRVCGAGREQLAAELRAVDAGVGLALAGVCTPEVERLTRKLVGRECRAADLPRLRAAAAPVRDLLPGGVPATVDGLLAQACRSAAAPAQGTHPADAAVTAAVLVGALRARLAAVTA